MRRQVGVLAPEQQVLDGGKEEIGRGLSRRRRFEDVDRQRIVGQGGGQALVQGRLSGDVDGEPAQALGDALAVAQQSRAPAFWMSGSPAGASNPSV